MTKQLFLLPGCLLFVVGAVLSQDNYNEISLPELMKKKQQGEKNMVIVDVRTNGEYYDSSSRSKGSRIGRIKDALHIELRELQQNPDAVKQLEPYKDKDIYLICSHSYRSRSASNILLKNGFTHVNNVQGGMTEWFRRYDDMAPYMNKLYETSVAYKNQSSAGLANDLVSGKKVLLIGIASTPRFFWDSANARFYDHLPLFKDALYFRNTDSMAVLQAAQKEKNVPIVLFNTVNAGAAELADWLTAQGSPGVSYLVGGPYYFYEYVRNKGLTGKINKFLSEKNKIDFITPVNYCRKTGDRNIQLVDLRHDTLFNKINDGIKNDYRYAKNSVNFYSGKGESAFMQVFPDKQKEYVLMSGDGVTGLEMADALSKKGYKIAFMLGGLQRLEWYTINLESFGCKDILVQ